MGTDIRRDDGSGAGGSGAGGFGAGGASRVASLVAQVRGSSRVIAAEEAQRLRLVAELAESVAVTAAVMLASVPRVPGAPPDHAVIDAAVDDELQAVLGISASPAARLVDLARRLTSVLPQVLAALAAGQLDLSRARVLAEVTEVLPDPAAREVADQLLEAAGDAPWEGLSPRAWRARAERTVVRVDPDAARRRRREAHARRAVRSWPTSDGMAELFITTAAADVAMAEQVLTDLANAHPANGPDGEHVSMDQRRVDSLMDVFRRVRDGREMPGVPVRRERELALVLHADTFFGDGPAAGDPGEIRGLSASSPLDASSAREQAHAMATTSGGPGPAPGPAPAPAPGAGSVAGASPAGAGTVNVLLVDRTGNLQRVLRLPTPPQGGSTRPLLHQAITTRLDKAPPLRAQSYAPTAAIADHVRARNPRCLGYDCPRSAHRCDLDHDTPWPRGPTDITNLGPRCPRQHEIKTRGLIQTTLHTDGTLHTTMLTGLPVTTRPEPLPGYAPGEGHAPGAGYAPGEGP